jgi:hypothetical protein
VFGPSREALDLFKPICKISHHLIAELLSVWLKFNPELMCVWKSLFIELNDYSVARFLFVNLLGFLFVRFGSLNLEVGK